MFKAQDHEKSSSFLTVKPDVDSSVVDVDEADKASKGSLTDLVRPTSSQVSPLLKDNLLSSERVKFLFTKYIHIYIYTHTDKLIKVTPHFLHPSDVTFKYDKFFEKKIECKKRDHTYRVFKTVNRRAFSFPMADNYCESLQARREVSVWCSNDYLGMSGHPKVTRAIM